MLDILFVLLLFFMVSAGAQKHEASLTTQLPGQGQPGKDVPVRLTIDEDGQVSISDAAVDTPTDHHMPTLVARLKGVMGQSDTTPVIISPARTTKQQRVVDVLNACAAAKVKNLAFGAASE
jgi:biopolymer transport protein ExbD